MQFISRWLMASWGVQTIGSPCLLNDVFRMASVPVILPYSLMSSW